MSNHHYQFCAKDVQGLVHFLSLLNGLKNYETLKQPARLGSVFWEKGAPKEFLKSSLFPSFFILLK
jgi:hypothetical protein